MVPKIIFFFKSKMNCINSLICVIVDTLEPVLIERFPLFRDSVHIRFLEKWGDFFFFFFFFCI